MRVVGHLRNSIQRCFDWDSTNSTCFGRRPPFEDYSVNGRTYRYFKGKPLYPFGYGLSYTTFSYSGPMLPKNAIKAGESLVVEVVVTNTGKRDGDEVAQVYLSFPKRRGGTAACV